jgi:nucleoside-diphosphate-sugar epimerase
MQCYAIVETIANPDNEFFGVTEIDMSERVLILGANGRLGRALVTAFAAAEWAVLAQTRRPLAYAVTSNVRTIRTRIDDSDHLVMEARGADVVVHAMNANYTRWASEALPLAHAAIGITRQLGATLMFPGNVYNFGSPMPALLREDTPQRSTTRKGGIRAQTESLLRAESASGLRSIVIRAGDFYGGGGVGSWMDMVIAKNLVKGKIVYPGPLDLPHASAYLPDLARTFVAVAEARERCEPFETLHFAGNTLTGQQMVEALTHAARRAGLLSPAQTPVVGKLPWWAMRAGAWAVPMWRELLEMRYLWDEAHSLDESHLRELLGRVPRTLLDEVMDQTLAGLGLRPMIKKGAGA